MFDNNWQRWAQKVRECNQLVRVDSKPLQYALRRLVRGVDTIPCDGLLRAGRWIIVEHRRRESGYRPADAPVYCKEFHHEL